MPQLDLQFRPVSYWDPADPLAAIPDSLDEIESDFLPGEVEIARIILDSTLGDVFSFRARHRGGGRRILYRVVDEYTEPGEPGWTCRPASSGRPLTLGQVIGLIDNARSPNFDFGDGPLTDLFRDFQEGAHPENIVHFVTVESDFYPGLAEYFDRRAQEWLQWRRRELGSGVLPGLEFGHGDRGIGA